MQNILIHAKRFLRDEDGVTAIEYGLIAALIAIVIIGSVKTLGTQPEHGVQRHRRFGLSLPAADDPMPRVVRPACFL